MIEIENKKLHDLIVTKDNLVDVGRSISAKIDKKEIEIKGYQDKEKKITGSVKPDPALKARGDELAKLVEDTVKELEKIGKKIEAQKLAAVPQDLRDKHLTAMKEREQLERELNKTALKVQKVKDRIIPMVQKIVKPLLNEYDDTETVQTKNGKVIIKTFNYLEDFKAKFKK